MQNYLLRDDAPLTEAEWERIDEEINDVATKQLVGRRILPLFGPVGIGVQVVPLAQYESGTPGTVSALGSNGGDDAVKLSSRSFIELPIVSKDFTLHWRDVESARMLNTPLDMSAVSAAGSACAFAEDDLLFNGNAELGQEGLLNHSERQIFGDVSDWSASSAQIYMDVVRATEMLVEAGFYQSFAMVVSPKRYSQMHRVAPDLHTREIKMVREIVTAGVLQSAAVADDKALILAISSANVDIAVAQDITTAYLGASDMNHRFRVFESLALRVKQPKAICTLEWKSTKKK